MVTFTKITHFPPKKTLKPNPKLASGVNLHAFLAKAVEEQSGRGREPTGDLEFEAVDEAPV